MPLFQSRSSRFSSPFSRCAALALVAGGFTWVGAQAQQAAPASAVADASPVILIADVIPRSMDLASVAGVSYSSSSDSLAAGDVTADPGTLSFRTLSFAGAGSALQPPPRRRYGRPRYNDSSHNSDGSNKYTFEGAVGLELPTGNTYHYFNTNYAFQAGGGRQFNKKVAILAQFDYDHFGINGRTLGNQISLYNDGCSTTAQTCLGNVDGNNHIWSFTLNPTYSFIAGDKYGAYVVLGGGFYHKVTAFTTPQTGYYNTGFGYIPVTQNATFDHYTSNAVGGNLGFGLTYKFSRFADERFFVEARYVIVDNKQREGYTYSAAAGGLVATGANADPNNFFPANSNRTTYVPIKLGIRF